MSPLFGISISLICYIIAYKIQQKTKCPLLNPLLISSLLIILILLIFKIDYQDYSNGGSVINMLLLPATAVLAVSIYQKIDLLKKDAIPIIIGTTIGSLTSIISVNILCKIFNIEEIIKVSLFAKSVTTPIAVSISESNGGISSITVFAVIVTGIFGSIFAPILIKILKLKDKTSIGIAIGTASHAMGTSKALELGEIEGAMSGLAIGICGIITTFLSLILI